MSRTSHDIAALIVQLLNARGHGKAICPSEVARAYAAEEWRQHLRAVREAALMLADEGKIVIKQKGQVVDGRTARGPIRLALPPA